MRIDVERVHWFSTYRVHHRVADRFRQGRAFLLGDAAHIHSPVGGQGMNTGIGDAVNLAWKLAAVLQRSCGRALLDSYEPERIALRATPGRDDRSGVHGVTSDGPIARRVRLNVVPLVVPLIFRFAATRRFMFRTVSQTAVNYRAALERGGAGAVHGGDRLPVGRTGSDGSDNFTPLTSLDWQVHVYGEATAEIRRCAGARAAAARVSVARGVPSRRPPARRDLSRATRRLHRPADAHGVIEALTSYLDAHKLKARLSSDVPQKTLNKRRFLWRDGRTFQCILRPA